MKHVKTQFSRLRKSRGLTLEKTSALTGLSPSYLSRIERKERRANVDIIAKLAEVYDISPEIILNILLDNAEETW